MARVSAAHTVQGVFYTIGRASSVQVSRALIAQLPQCIRTLRLSEPPRLFSSQIRSKRF